MFARIGYTWRVMGASWAVLKKDKELLIFPFLSGVACLLVMVSFALPIIMTGAYENIAAEAGDETQGQMADIIGYVLLFAFYFANYFVITFFNSCIVGSAVQRLSGLEPSFGDALKAGISRLPQIFAWALMAATVGMILRLIEERSAALGRFVAGLLGVAWTMATFLVVPVLVVEGLGPWGALKKSAVLLKKTWGDQLVGNFGFGIIFLLLFAPAIIVIPLGFVFLGAVVGGIIAAVAVIYMIVLALVQSALQAIFQAALYVYAEKGTAPEAFGDDMIRGAMGAKS